MIPAIEEERPMFQSIVVAYDGSEHASKALEIGAGLAATEQARLGIIYVVEAGYANLPDEPGELGRIEYLKDPTPKLMADLGQVPTDLAANVARSAIAAQQVTLQWAEHLVTAVAEDARSYGAQQVEATTATGDPAAEVVKFANARNADLIVCGSRGLGRVKQLLLGSTSHKIAQLADCSCLTIKLP
jgi:nucleotide-binding universal stress UspA family protein